MVLEEVLTDFKGITSQVLKVHGKYVTEGWSDPLESLKEPCHISPYDKGIDRLESDILVRPDGVVWFDGSTDIWGNVADPQDYVPIREDYEKLKQFLGKILDGGRISTGNTKSGIDEVNPADYAVWMYQFSENPTFRQNFERAAVEILTEEFGRERPSLSDVEEAVVQETMERLRSQDLESHETPEAYVRNLVQEWGENARDPPSGVKRFYGNPKNFWLWSRESTGGSVKVKEREELATELTEIDWSPEKISGEVMQRLLSVYGRGVEHRSRKDNHNIDNAVQGEYNRLIGSIDIVRLLAERQEDSAIVTQGHNILNGHRDDTTLGEDRVFDNYSSIVNLPDLVLETLAYSQPKDGSMREFWLKRMRAEKVRDRYLTAARGLMWSGDESEVKNHVPEVLKILRQRKWKLGKPLKGKYERAENSDEGTFDMHLRGLAQIAVGSLHYLHDKLHKKSESLDVIVDEDVSAPGVARYQILRVSPNGYEETAATHKVGDGSIEGDDLSQRTVRDYRQNKGLPVLKDVQLTSLQARQIQSTSKMRLIKPEGHDLSGSYEGVAGLNNVLFPFVYDPSGGTLLLGDPVERMLTLGEMGQWEKDVGFDEFNTRVSHSKLHTLDELGQVISKKVKGYKKNEGGWTRGSMQQMNGKINNTAIPYFTEVFNAKLS
jgi:hypothetical protein